MKDYRNDATDAASRARVEGILEFLTGEAALQGGHDRVEEELGVRGRDLLRELMQMHLAVRAKSEQRVPGVVGADGSERRCVEPSSRKLATVFGVVTVDRLAYRASGVANLHLADVGLQLPAEKFSYGVQHMVARPAPMTSYDVAVEQIRPGTGQSFGKRQVAELAGRSGEDLHAFSIRVVPRLCAPTDFLVLTVDGKGIVMRPDALRVSSKYTTPIHKLQSRGSKGEVQGRKRIAIVAATYDVAPFPRKPLDVLASGPGARLSSIRPDPRNKQYRVSVEKSAPEVIAAMFDDAAQRDPRHLRRWIVLVDGDRRLIDPIKAEARKREIDVIITVDIVHVTEYVWRAAWSFFNEGDPAAEVWVRKHMLKILEGKASIVAGAIRRAATHRSLAKAARKSVDICARYLLARKKYLKYGDALTSGAPIGTGVIEGACRHIVKDRMDITGARWSVAGAEAILKLRTLRANGDLTNTGAFTATPTSVVSMAARSGWWRDAHSKRATPVKLFDEHHWVIRHETEKLKTVLTDL